MKAIVISEYGDENVLKYEDAPKPEINAGDVLVKVKAVGINPVEWQMREGMWEKFGLKLPVILGYEIAGIIEEIGADVKNFKVGDEVFGYSTYFQGGYAEYIAVKETDLALKPQTIDFENAAAIPVGASTAYQAIFGLANLQKGQKILIHAAAGGVGSMAVQLAKVKGAYVIGTASGKNEEFVKSLGVDEFVDYTKTPFETVVKDADVVFDLVGGETQERSFQVLKKDGFTVSAAQPPSEETAEKFGVKAGMVYAVPSIDQLKEFGELAEQGKLKTHVETILPLSEIKKAHELSKSGRTRGKIVLKVDKESLPQSNFRR